MTRFITVFAIPLFLSVFSLTAYGHDKEDEDKNIKEYELELVPLNNSGVRAEVELKLINETTLLVSIEASGLESGKLHPQHIHGFNTPLKQATCPGLQADTDGDGVISVGEGLPTYGPILLPLIPFDLVDTNGELNYTIQLTINPETMLPLSKRVVLLHGLSVNGQYIPSLPIACGIITEED